MLNKTGFWKEFNSKEKYPIERLPDFIQTLAAKTMEKSRKAYAPYSGFGVAALIKANDEEFIATNAETCNYDGTCAEAGAVAAYVTNAKDKEIEFVVVAGKAFNNIHPQDDVFITPCGRCRQRLFEHSSPDTPVICLNEAGTKALVASISDLLPFAFSPTNL